MYKLLSSRMNLDVDETHIKLFNREQCKQAIKILRPMYIQLYGKDLDYKKEDNSMKDFLKRTGKTLFHAFEAGIGIACLTIGVIDIKRDISSNN